MVSRALLIAAGVFVVSAALAAPKEYTSIHPEDAFPDNLPPLFSRGPYADTITRVQQSLREQGFDPGPVNGVFGSKTQAAIAQFQLGWLLPVSGMLDEQTLKALDVQPPTSTPMDAAEPSAPGNASQPPAATGASKE